MAYFYEIVEIRTSDQSQRPVARPITGLRLADRARHAYHVTRCCTLPSPDLSQCFCRHARTLRQRVVTRCCTHFQALFLVDPLYRSACFPLSPPLPKSFVSSKPALCRPPLSTSHNRTIFRTFPRIHEMIKIHLIVWPVASPAVVRAHARSAATAVSRLRARL